MSDDEIKSARYHSPKMYCQCVPPPSMLYWRVRAVYALCGNMKDSKTQKPLFNDNARKKAKNVLQEILAGLYSDPSGVQWYKAFEKRWVGDEKQIWHGHV